MESSDIEQRFNEALLSLLDPSRVIKIASELDEETELIETTEGDDEEAEAAPEKKAAAATHINLFQHPDAHPLVLDILLLQKYGPEWMLWEPETLYWRIPQDFRTSDVSDLNMSKVQAVKTLHMVDTPWTEWEVFLWCAMPVNGLFPDFDQMQVPTVGQCLIAIDTFGKVRTDVSWGAEVKVYLGTVWRHDGIFCPIDPGNFFEIDRSGTTVDCEKLSQEWPTVRKNGVAPTGETADEEQLRRMLDAHQDLQVSRENFERQLRVVLG